MIMIKIWNSFWNWFFDLGWLFFILAMFMGIMVFVASNDVSNKAKARAQAKACYSRSMIVAQTDAGSYCVDPKTMIELKEVQ